MKGQRFVFLLTVVLATLASARAGDQTAANTVCGRLSEFDELPVLEVWGTPAEAGFAHGYLLARQIIRLFDEVVLDPKIGAAPEAYEALLLPMANRHFAWAASHEEELAGLLSGMHARLGPDNVRSRRLDRALTVMDLKLANTISDWRGAFCSSFAAWGALTKDGETITGRNLDYGSTEGLRKGQLVLVHRGEHNARAWVGVTWPGLIGVYTAMNGEGVTIAMHDAAGLPIVELEGLTPRSLVLRAALEGAGAQTWLADVRGVLRRHRCLVGSNVMVSAPHLPGRPPACVYEYDGNQQHEQGVTLRILESNEAPLVDAICCTNHMRSRREPRQCGRYEKLVRRLSEMTTEREQLDPARALDVIRLAANDETLHSVVFVPHRRVMCVQISALRQRPVEIELDEWLRRAVPKDGVPTTAPAAGQRAKGGHP